MTIAEHLKELVKQGATFAGFANLVKWDDNSKGSFVRFAIDTFEGSGELKLTESPFKGCLEGAKDGQRFYLVAIMASNKEPEESPKSYAGQAKLMSQDEGFHKYLFDRYGLNLNLTNLREEWIEKECGVTTCADLIEGSEAGRKFKTLQADYLEWKNN